MINDSYGDGEFYVITRDGTVTQVSHLNPDPAAGTRYFSDIYSWSPDGQHLAFWRGTMKGSAVEATLPCLTPVPVMLPTLVYPQVH